MAIGLPREKLNRVGLSGLTDVDLVAIILGVGVRGANFMSVARKVVGHITKYGVESDIYKVLQRIHGIGQVKSMQIACALELGRRVFGTDTKQVIRSRKDAVRVVDYLKKKKQEYAVVMYLDARNCLVQTKTVAIGSLNMLVVEPRDIFEQALRYHAVSIILVHNHPSGDRRPSRADLEFTKRIKKAGELLGVDLIDHIIV